MHREHVKYRSALSVALVMLAIVAACAPSPTPTATPRPKPAATAAPTSPPTPVEVKLDYWNFLPEMVEANLVRFESQNPDIKVIREMHDGMAYFDKLVANFAAGVSMDVIYGDETKRAQYV